MIAAKGTQNSSTVLFTEVQGAAKRGVRRFFGGLCFLFAAALAVSVLRSGNLDGPGVTFYVAGLMCSAVAWAVAQLRMETVVREDGIYVRFPFLQPAYAFYPWSSISRMYLREYNALMEYGGWGIRCGAKGKAYVFGGNQGLQLELHNGTSVLIGTRCPQQLEQVLAALHKH